MEKLEERYLRWVLKMEDTGLSCKRGVAKGEVKGKGRKEGMRI